jgi:hypothetical protein
MDFSWFRYFYIKHVKAKFPFTFATATPCQGEQPSNSKEKLKRQKEERKVEG